MHVHLALPGLLWPAQALSDLVFDLDLPALYWLLGRGRPARAKAQPFEHWLAACFGHDAYAPPVAALRLLGDDLDPGNAHWIAADPTHLAFEHGQPTLSDPADLKLTAEECAELAAAIAPALAAVGDFSLYPGSHGYVKLKAPVAMITTPLSAAIGRGVAELLPRGIDATRWLHLANDVQMALHDLPLNHRREAAGQPTINTLCFWGAGSLPMVLSATTTTPYAKVGGGDTLTRGCTHFAGASWQPSADPSADPVPTEGSTLLIDDRLLAPTQQLDAHAWREALLAIEHERLTPLLAALRGGRCQRLTLTALGDEAVVNVELTRLDALRFWRRPRSLVELFQ